MVSVITEAVSHSRGPRHLPLVADLRKAKKQPSLVIIKFTNPPICCLHFTTMTFPIIIHFESELSGPGHGGKHISLDI